MDVRRSDTSRLFEEPIRLDEYDLPQMRILINASGRWGHDVICFSVGFGNASYHTNVRLLDYN